MAFGDHESDAELRDAWRAFCLQLEQAGDQVFKDHNPANEAQRVDAFRFLTQNLGQTFDLALETRDTRYPALHPFCTPTRKLGSDAADFSYHQAWLDGNSVYRVSGSLGTARFINFTLQGERPETQPGTDIPSLHEPFGDLPEVNVFGHQLDTDADGNFELVIGGEERSGNWLPSTKDTRKLFLRQGFDHWHELPAQLNIERLGMTEPKPLPTSSTLREAMQWAGSFVTGLMEDWPDHPYQHSPFVDPINSNCFPSGGADDDDSKRGRAVAHMCWDLKPDDALIIEFDALDSFWMISAMGAFFNSLDYLYRPVSYTPGRTKVDSDGKVRLVLAHSDPGYHNWLDTQGFERGNITYRNLLSTESAFFNTRLLMFGQLDTALPANCARVTAEERTQMMLQRFNSIRRRHGYGV